MAGNIFKHSLVTIGWEEVKIFHNFKMARHLTLLLMSHQESAHCLTSKSKTLRSIFVTPTITQLEELITTWGKLPHRNFLAFH